MGRTKRRSRVGGFLIQVSRFGYGDPGSSSAWVIAPRELRFERSGPKFGAVGIYAPESSEQAARLEADNVDRAGKGHEVGRG